MGGGGVVPYFGTRFWLADGCDVKILLFRAVFSTCGLCLVSGQVILIGRGVSCGCFSGGLGLFWLGDFVGFGLSVFHLLCSVTMAVALALCFITGDSCLAYVFVNHLD